MKKKAVIANLVWVTIVITITILGTLFIYEFYNKYKKKSESYASKIEKNVNSVLLLYKNYDPSLEVFSWFSNIPQKSISAVTDSDYYYNNWVLVNNGVLSDTDLLKLYRYVEDGKNNLIVVDNYIDNNNGYLNRILGSNFFVPIKVNEIIWVTEGLKKVMPIETKLYNVQEYSPIITTDFQLIKDTLVDLGSYPQGILYTFVKIDKKYYLVLIDDSQSTMDFIDLDGNKITCHFGEVGSTIQCSNWNITTLDVNYFLISYIKNGYKKERRISIITFNSFPSDGDLLISKKSGLFFVNSNSAYYLVTSNGLLDISSININFGKIYINNGDLKLILYKSPLAYKYKNRVVVPYNVAILFRDILYKNLS